MAQTLKTPGVYRFEKDLSEIAVPAGTSTGAMVLSALQGIANSRVLVTSDKNLIGQFGIPVVSAQDVGIYAGIEFLKESDALYVVRATHGDEQYANIKVSGSSSDPITASNYDTILAKASSAIYVETDDGNLPEAIYDLDNTSIGDAVVRISCVGPGSYGNNIGITLFTCACSATNGISGNFDWSGNYGSNDSKVYKISVYLKDDNGNFGNSPEEVFYVSNEYWKNGAGAQMFAKDVINGKSNYIYVNVKEGELPGQIYTTSAGKPVSLDGGADSTAGVDATDYSNAWHLFDDKNKVSVNILIDTHRVITETTDSLSTQIGDLAATRMDCIACVQAGTSGNTDESSIIRQYAPGFANGSYVATYAGWDKIYDSFNDRNVYVPKCIFGAALMARTDRVANTWNAPAGVNRGVLPSVGQNIVWSDAQIGNLYDANINTSRYIRGIGHVMWGQKTAQRKKSALDRINVRRLLLYIENTLEPALLPFLFENNTEKTRLRAKSLCDDFLNTIGPDGLTKFEVVCDESNNTSTVIDRNEMVVDVYVQPAKTIEFIRLQVTITKTGVNFSEIR